MEGFCDVCEQSRPTQYWRCCAADVCDACAYDPVARAKAAASRVKQRMQGVYARLLGKAS